MTRSAATTDTTRHGQPGESCVLPLPGGIAAPLPFYEHFDRIRPVEVDVGCGMGRFLLARAAAHPDVQFLGVDRMLGRIRKIDRKVRRLGLANVRLLRLEAAYTLRFLLPAHAIRCFYIFFPDPWPKRRHHKRRLFSSAFNTVLWTCLEPGGEVQAATDHLDYFAAIERLLRADPRFEAVPAMARGESEQTDFERIFRAQNLPVGACGFRARPAVQVPEQILARLQREAEAAWSDGPGTAEDDESAGARGAHGRA